jgi:hypothetical protein
MLYSQKKFNVSKRELKKHNLLKFTFMFVSLKRITLYERTLNVMLYFRKNLRCLFKILTLLYMSCIQNWRHETLRRQRFLPYVMLFLYISNA